MTARRDRQADGLDRLLGQVQFEPRASLGAEILGRWRRGETPTAPDRQGSPRLRLLITAGLLAVGAIAILPLGGARTVDRCCLDLDGGGERDDGLLVVARRGVEVRRLAVYEDRDGSGSFTAGDQVRFERRGPPGLTPSLGADDRTVEFCCLDYDGGGPSDDALLVVRHPPDVIRMAAIYERQEDAGRIAPLR